MGSQSRNEARGYNFKGRTGAAPLDVARLRQPVQVRLPARCAPEDRYTPRDPWWQPEYEGLPRAQVRTLMTLAPYIDWSESSYSHEELRELDVRAIQAARQGRKTDGDAGPESGR